MYYFPFIKYQWISKILLVSVELKSTERKNVTMPSNPFFFFHIIIKSFEILPKHSA